MKAPKILPWIAKRAEISEELALKLWRRAVSEAEMLTGTHEGSTYHALAVERFLLLVEEETGESPFSDTNIAWMWRHQSRMAALGLTAAQNTVRLWQANWAEFLASQQRAA